MPTLRRLAWTDAGREAGEEDGGSRGEDVVGEEVK
jgi:hypothetical protein